MDLIQSTKGFTSKRYPPECRIQASNFIRLLCHTSVLTLQMFIAWVTGSLDDDKLMLTQMPRFENLGRLVRWRLSYSDGSRGACGQWNCECLWTPKSYSKERFLPNVYPWRLTRSINFSACQRVGSGWDPHKNSKYTFSVHSSVAIRCACPSCYWHKADHQTWVIVAETKSTDWPRFASGLMRACEQSRTDVLVQLLKAVKHLSMSASLLETLQNSNALDILVRLLDNHSSGPHATVNLPSIISLR